MIESIFYTTIFWAIFNCGAVYVMLYVTRNRQPIQVILAQQEEAKQTDATSEKLTPDDSRHFAGSDEYSDLPDVVKDRNISEISFKLTVK